MSAFGLLRSTGQIVSTAVRMSANPVHAAAGIATYPLRHFGTTALVGTVALGAAAYFFGPMATLNGLYMAGSTLVTAGSAVTGGVATLWSGAASAVTAAKTFFAYNALTCTAKVAALKGQVVTALSPDQLQHAAEVLRNCAAYIKPAAVAPAL